MSPHAADDLKSKIKKYWDEGPPMTFLDLGWKYEEKRKFRYELQDYMHDFFKFSEQKDKLVLDLGSGAGIDSLEFTRYGAEVVSVDLSYSSVLATRNLYNEADYGQRANVILCDARRLPFRKGVFDIVYSFGVLHHIPEVEEVLREVCRVLKSQGEFMGMVYNQDSLLFAYSILYLKGVRAGLLRFQDIESLANLTERRPGNPYTKLYTKEELHRLLGNYFFFNEISVRFNVIDTEKQRKVKLNIPDELELGWHLVFKCRYPKKD